MRTRKARNSKTLRPCQLCQLCLPEFEDYGRNNWDLTRERLRDIPPYFLLRSRSNLRLTRVFALAGANGTLVRSRLPKSAQFVFGQAVKAALRGPLAESSFPANSRPGCAKGHRLGQ